MTLLRAKRNHCITPDNFLCKVWRILSHFSPYGEIKFVVILARDNIRALSLQTPEQCSLSLQFCFYSTVEELAPSLFYTFIFSSFLPDRKFDDIKKQEKTCTNLRCFEIFCWFSCRHASLDNMMLIMHQCSSSNMHFWKDQPLLHSLAMLSKILTGEEFRQNSCLEWKANSLFSGTLQCC